MKKMSRFPVLLLLLVSCVPAYAGGLAEDPEKMQSLFNIAAQVCLVASLIANFTPNETDNKIVGWIKKGVDLLAGNWFLLFKRKG